jgi:GH15 family glucan-1,4-alpha-glucosidase
MSRPIEDYALLSDLRTSALVGRNGSIDWFCAPRFDSEACFAALLGDEGNGFWRISPQGTRWKSTRRYVDNSMVLETRFESPEGCVTLTDFMPLSEVHPASTGIVRIVRGERGRLPLEMALVIRFDYGKIVPWVRRQGRRLVALSGPNLLELATDVPILNRNFRTTAKFSVGAGETATFALNFWPSLARRHAGPEPSMLCEETLAWWKSWSTACSYEGDYRDEVLGSLVTLKALTHEPTGGVIAAPTTSLPENIGGERNWDYRFCWLRDATFTFYALLSSGLKQEAMRWRDWLLRATAGMPSQLQTVYGPAGERMLPEIQIPWLGGYEYSRPVRIGNKAHLQLQLDVYGELMDLLHVSRRTGIKDTRDSWNLQRALMDFVESGWRQADNGIWEVRGPRRQFTHSKVMMWVAIDRAVKAVERFGLPGPVDQWKQLRAEVHAEVCDKGYDPERNAFVQSYGSTALDSSLLMIPLVGFLPPDDARVRGTAAAVERELMMDGFLKRYEPAHDLEHLDGQEGAFLPCTFWLADNYAMVGKREKAKRLFESLLAVRNDVGLLAEEYDPVSKRLLGNFPQAFSHVALINTALNLSRERPAEQRSKG